MGKNFCVFWTHGQRGIRSTMTCHSNRIEMNITHNNVYNTQRFIVF